MTNPNPEPKPKPNLNPNPNPNPNSNSNPTPNQELGDHDGTYLTTLLMMQPVSILFGPLWAAG